MKDLPWRNPDYFGSTDEEEKRRFRRDISRSAWSLLIMLVAANLFALVLSFVLMSQGIMQSGMLTDLSALTTENLIAAMGLSQAIYDFLASYLPSILGEVLLILLLRYWVGFRLNETSMVSSKTQRPKQMTALAYFSGWGCAALASVVITLLLQLLSMAGWVMNMPAIQTPMPNEDPMGFILSMSYVCFLGPILEEVIFRGFILNGLKKYGEAAGVLVSTLFFMMYHGNLAQTITPLLVGFLFGFLTIRTGSLWPAILCHILHNTTAMAMDYIPGDWYNMAFAVYAIVGICALLYFLYRFLPERKNLKTFGRTSRGERALELLLAPGFIVYFILYLLFSALYFIL